VKRANMREPMRQPGVPVRPLRFYLMPHGILPLGLGQSAQYFDPAFTRSGRIDVLAVNNASRHKDDRRLHDRMITFAWSGGDPNHSLPDENINILYNPTWGLEGRHGLNQADYNACLGVLVRWHRMVVWNMRDLYFLLLHMDLATRRRMRRLEIHDVTTGPYTQQALQLLQKCSILNRLTIFLCHACGDTKAPSVKWNHWQRLAKGLGVLSQAPGNHIIFRRRRPNELCEACRRIEARTGVAPQPLSDPARNVRRYILARYVRRP